MCYDQLKITDNKKQPEVFTHGVNSYEISNPTGKFNHRDQYLQQKDSRASLVARRASLIDNGNTSDKREFESLQNPIGNLDDKEPLDVFENLKDDTEISSVTKSSNKIQNKLCLKPKFNVNSINKLGTDSLMMTPSPIKRKEEDSPDSIMILN